MVIAGAIAQAQAAQGGDDGIPAQVVAAIIAGAVSLLVLAVTNWANSQREKDSRRRETYAKAFAAVAAYKEFPYVVRRRRGGDAEVAADERVRISEALRSVQQDLSYYSAWMADGVSSRRIGLPCTCGRDTSHSGRADPHWVDHAGGDKGR